MPDGFSGLRQQVQTITSSPFYRVRHANDPPDLGYDPLGFKAYKWEKEHKDDPNKRVDVIENLSGAKFGSEEYYQYLEENPILNLFGQSEKKFDKFGPPEPYRIADETQQIFEKQMAAGETIREQAQEMVDVSGARRGMAEAEGAGVRRQAREETAAAAVSSAQMAGGASVGALGAAAQIQQETVADIRDQGITTQMFRDQAEQEYRQALMDQGSAEISATQQEIQAMQTMLGAKEQQYQVNVLDPFYARQQYLLSKV